MKRNGKSGHKHDSSVLTGDNADSENSNQHDPHQEIARLASELVLKNRQIENMEAQLSELTVKENSRVPVVVGFNLEMDLIESVKRNMSTNLAIDILFDRIHIKDDLFLAALETIVSNFDSTILDILFKRNEIDANREITAIILSHLSKKNTIQTHMSAEHDCMIVEG